MALREPAVDRSARPMLGNKATGNAPLPIWLRVSVRVTSATPSSPCAMAGSKRWPTIAISLARRRSSRRVGRRSTKRSGSAYKRSTASSAARRILSRRKARFSGFRASRAIKSARPTTSPACGPPSNLSPLKVTRSAPCARASAAVGSCGKPQRARSTSDPLPRSSTKGKPCPRASVASFAAGTLAVNPWIT